MSEITKGSYVTNGAEDWQHRVEGRVSATTEKFGGRARVGDRWVDISTLRVVADDDRCLDCDGCNGTGTYYGRGYVENGVFKGHTGPCFRCQGTGKQTPKDRKRNGYYDNHVRRIYI
jgi:hypothetical protein